MMKVQAIISNIKIYLIQSAVFLGSWISPTLSHSQNLIPNPSFEDTSGCFLLGHPDINCTPYWGPTTMANGAMNTADICYNTAVFFPPSSIPAFHGTNYAGFDCQPNNSEYLQTEMLQTMQAGKTYCVSFYVSVCDQTITPASTVGVYFSVGELLVNPYQAGIAADVQGAVPHDPTIWTKITGTYTAVGGENHIVIGGFENSGSPAFVYMYMDMIEVYELPNESSLSILEICPNTMLTLQTATAPANSYLWNTGDTTSQISISDTGIYYVEKTYGNCVLIDSFLVVSGNCTPDTNSVIDSIPNQTLFIPSAFTPNGDGTNDYFSIYGEGLTELTVNIFNRWGELIYTSNQINFAWDGKNKGQLVQQDVYVYQLQYKNQLGVIEERRGRVVLIK